MFEDLRFIGRTVSLPVAGPVEPGDAVALDSSGRITRSGGPLFGRVLQVNGDKATVQFDGLLVVPYAGIAVMPGTIREITVSGGRARLGSGGRRVLVVRYASDRLAILAGA